MVSQFQFENKTGFLGGVGLRPPHYPTILNNISDTKTKIQWFEVISENFMDTEGRPIMILEQIRKDFPVAVHGVSLSIGSGDPINLNYLGALKKLIKRVDPFLVSDHFCWTGANAENVHDLLPIPMDRMNLNRVVDKVNQVQDFLQRAILLENASAYVSYQDSVIPEWDFINEVISKTGCGLLLDINNVYVTCSNFDIDPKKYIDLMPLEKIGQVHLAGYTDMGNYLFDTHGEPVHDAVWDLYKYFLIKKNNIPIMIEWDQNIPEFSVLESELQKAVKIRDEVVNNKETIKPN